MSTIDGVTFCDARDQAAMLAREPAFAVPCERSRGGCGAAKGDTCKLAAPATEPAPWTDAHRREAFRAILRAADEMILAGRITPADRLACRACDLSEAEGFLRSAFENYVGFDTARIDSEIALVRERAEQPTAPAWTPPPGVHVEVLRGSPTGPLLVAHVRLDPGAEVPREVHWEQSEQIVPIVGAVERVFADGETSPCGHSGIVVGAGAQHTIRNASTTDPAEYIAVLRRIATVSDTEPAPAVTLGLTEVQIAALRVCAFEAWESWRQAKLDFHRAHLSIDFWDVEEELANLGLSVDGEITDAGRAALAAIDAAEPTCSKCGGTTRVSNAMGVPERQCVACGVSVFNPAEGV